MRRKKVIQQFRNQAVNFNKIPGSFSWLLNVLSFGIICPTRENQLLNKALYSISFLFQSHKIKEDLDIVTVLKKQSEFEKFKSIILDKNQLMLFNFAPKPIITLENSQDKLHAKIKKNSTS